MDELKTPDSIEEHQPKYKSSAWKEYTLQELGMWVHLFVKRAKHRKDTQKRAKDLTDAQNYLNMMQAHLDLARQECTYEVFRTDQSEKES